MSKVYNSVTELIGRTPLLRANNFIKANGLEADILVKLEYFNPAGSVKDRIAKAMIEKAEAEARTGNTSAALQSLNTLRKYRYNYGEGVSTDLKNGSSLSADQLLNEILTERRRELPLVSFQRTLDLKRYAFDSGKPWSKTVIEHKIGSKTFSKSITDDYFKSIPIDNPIIEYNPQWGLQVNSKTFEPYNAW